LAARVSSLGGQGPVPLWFPGPAGKPGFQPVEQAAEKQAEGRAAGGPSVGSESGRHQPGHLARFHGRQGKTACQGQGRGDRQPLAHRDVELDDPPRALPQPTKATGWSQNRQVAHLPRQGVAVAEVEGGFGGRHVGGDSPAEIEVFVSHSQCMVKNCNDHCGDKKPAISLQGFSLFYGQRK